MDTPGPRQPRPAPIEAYGNGGFRFAGMSHRGSLLCLPSGFQAWPPADASDLTPASFADVVAERDRLTFLLLGTGRVARFPGAEIRKLFVDSGIGLEIMDTGAACRTFNVMLAEGRPVAAALIAVT